MERTLLQAFRAGDLTPLKRVTALLGIGRGEPVDVVAAITPVPGLEMASRLLYAHTINATPSGPLPVVPLAVALLACACLHPAASRRKLALALWLLFPPVLLWAASLRYPLFTDRYVMVVAGAQGIRAGVTFFKPFGPAAWQAAPAAR